jgi:hypothetical protein
MKEWIRPNWLVENKVRMKLRRREDTFIRSCENIFGKALQVRS